MTINEISKIILDAAFEIHKKLGPGLLESVYETIMEYELIHTYRLRVSRQKGQGRTIQLHSLQIARPQGGGSLQAEPARYTGASQLPRRRRLRPNVGYGTA